MRRMLQEGRHWNLRHTHVTQQIISIVEASLVGAASSARRMPPWVVGVDVRSKLIDMCISLVSVASIALLGPMWLLLSWCYITAIVKLISFTGDTRGCECMDVTLNLLLLILLSSGFRRRAIVFG